MFLREIERYFEITIKNTDPPQVLLIKSVLFAGSSALAARYAKKISLPAILVAILAYQVVGTAFEWVIERNFWIAIQDFRMGVPGMLIQWLGGYALLRGIAKI